MSSYSSCTDRTGRGSCTGSFSCSSSPAEETDHQQTSHRGHSEGHFLAGR